MRDALEAANAKVLNLEAEAGAETRVIDGLSRLLAKLADSPEREEESTIEVG